MQPAATFAHPPTLPPPHRPIQRHPVHHILPDFQCVQIQKQWLHCAFLPSLAAFSRSLSLFSASFSLCRSTLALILRMYRRATLCGNPHQCLRATSSISTVSALFFGLRGKHVPCPQVRGKAVCGGVAHSATLLRCGAGCGVFMPKATEWRRQAEGGWEGGCLDTLPRSRQYMAMGGNGLPRCPGNTMWLGGCQARSRQRRRRSRKGTWPRYRDLGSGRGRCRGKPCAPGLVTREVLQACEEVERRSMPRQEGRERGRGKREGSYGNISDGGEEGERERFVRASVAFPKLLPIYRTASSILKCGLSQQISSAAKGCTARGRTNGKRWKAGASVACMLGTRGGDSAMGYQEGISQRKHLSP